MTEADRLDRVFDALPTPHLVLDPALRIVAVNRAYEAATARDRADLLGRGVFEAFPDNPDDPDAGGTTNLRASLLRVLERGQVDTMPLQKYDVPAPGGGFLTRWWSPVNAPVLDDDGTVVLLVHRVEDVSDFAREHGGEHPVPPVVAELHARSRELREALTAEAESSRRLAGLVEVARLLAGAASTAELCEVVVEHGLALLGAGGGAVAVTVDAATAGTAEDVVEVTLSASLGVPVPAEPPRLPLDGPLPVSVAAATGRPVLLVDADACERHSPRMAEVVRGTGLGTWWTLPLRVGGVVLGSIAIGWRDPQDLAERDVDLVHALVAQCAQSLAAVRARDAERARAREQRRMSETLQRSLLTAPFAPDHLQIAVRYAPAAADAQVGGDWYDCFITPGGATTVVVGDVVGHDRGAAAVMGQVRNVLRGISVTLGQPPALVLSGLDRALHQLGVPAVASAVLAQVEQDPAEDAVGLRTLRWSNAGHPPPVLLVPGRGARLLHAPADLLLGVDPGTDRHDHTVVLDPGATVVLCTDGLVERRDEPLDTGLERLRATVEELGELDAERLCDALLERLGAHAEDDVALLVLRAHPEDRPRPPEAGAQVVPPPLAR